MPPASPQVRLLEAGVKPTYDGGRLAWETDSDGAAAPGGAPARSSEDGEAEAEEERPWEARARANARGLEALRAGGRFDAAAAFLVDAKASFDRTVRAPYVPLTPPFPMRRAYTLPASSQVRTLEAGDQPTYGKLEDDDGACTLEWEWGTDSSSEGAATREDIAMSPDKEEAGPLEEGASEEEESEEKEVASHPAPRPWEALAPTMAEVRYNSR
jgi:hypothetical protein